MAALTSTEQKTLELPIEALPRVYWAVVSASTATESEWQELCAGRLGAECTACRIKITGAELRQLATAHTENAEENPKLERLRLNYCARKTCEGRFYQVFVQPDSERHWSSIKDQLGHTTPEMRETRARKERKPFLSSWAAPQIRPAHWMIAAAVTVALFFLLRYWIYGYRIPVIHKKHEYRVIQAPEKN